MKEFEITKHAHKKLKDRGIDFYEVKETISKSKWIRTRYKRFTSIRVFEYNQVWEGVFYRQKEVKVVFAKENGKIIVITAIARYFKEVN